MSKNMKLLSIFISIILLALGLKGIDSIANKLKTTEETYTKYIITTYSGGKEIERFEVSSEMRGNYGKGYVLVYENEKKEVVVFASTLEYKIEELSK